MKTNENVVDYVIGTEELQYNLDEVDNGLSEKMFASIIVEGFQQFLYFDKVSRS